MNLNILCFEDSEKYQVILREIFEQYSTKFLFFSRPEMDWNITNTGVLEQIVKFKPKMAIVDLRNDIDGDTTAGYRLIRQLKEAPETCSLPIVAWSVLFRDTPDGHSALERAQRYGAVALQKSEDIIPIADRFLNAANIDLST